MKEKKDHTKYTYISKTKSITAWQEKALQKSLNIRMVRLRRANYCSIEHFACKKLVRMLISDSKCGNMYEKKDDKCNEKHTMTYLRIVVCYKMAGERFNITIRSNSDPILDQFFEVWVPIS